MHGKSTHPAVLAMLALWAAGCLDRQTQPVSSVRPDGKPRAAASEINDAPAPHISAATHLASGKMLERQNDLFRAIDQYKKAIVADPRATQAYNRLGMVYQRLQRHEDAERIFQQGLRASPKSAVLHNNLGFCFLRRERFAKAEASFRSALDISPTFARARMNLAITLARSDQTEESAAQFAKVVTSPIAHFNVAVVRAEMQDYRGAEKALRKALELDPGFEPARRQLDRLLRLTRSSEGTTAQDKEANAPALLSVPLAGHPDEEVLDAP